MPMSTMRERRRYSMLKKPEELTANISKNKNGRWGFIIELGTDSSGRRRQKTSFKYSFKNQAATAAQKWIDEQKIAGNIPLVVKNDITISGYIPHFLKVYAAAPNRKPSTVKVRKSHLGRPRKMIGDYQVQKITMKEYQDFINTLIKENLSDLYIEHINVAMSLLFDQAVHEELRTDNPADNANLEKPHIYAADEFQEEIPVFFEIEELNEFLNLALNQVDYRWYALFYLMAHTGLRPGEALALRWKDIDLDKMKLNVYKTIYWENDRIDDYTLLSTKTSNGYRQVDISGHVADVLIEQKNRQKKERQFSWRWHDGDFVFTNMVNQGYPIKQGAAAYHMRKVMANMNVRKYITPHKLRHTHISLLAEAGVPLSVIKNRVGHGDSRITEKIYMHITNYQKEEAMKNYENMLEKRENGNYSE